MKFHAIALALLGIAMLSLPGCAGYTLGTTKPEAYAGVNKIWVPTFENETLEPRLAVLVTNTVISQLQQDGTYQISTKEEADAVLRGTIKEVRRKQQRSTSTNILRTRELAVTLDIAYRLEDIHTGAELQTANPYGIDDDLEDLATGRKLKDGVVSGRSTIFLDANFQLSEREAFPLAAEDAAEQIVSKLTDGW